MTLKLIKKISENQVALLKIKQGVELLHDSGILDYLREQGKPDVSGKTHDAIQLASEANRGAGYNQAVNDIFNFIDKVDAIVNMVNKPELKAKYGAAQSLLDRGDITQEEFNKLQGHK